MTNTWICASCGGVNLETVVHACERCGAQVPVASHMSSRYKSSKEPGVPHLQKSKAQGADTHDRPPPIADEARRPLDPPIHLNNELFMRIASLWPSPFVPMRFMEVQSDIIGYVQQKLPSSHESVFTVTGTYDRYVAGTCAEYISSTFPEFDGLGFPAFFLDAARFSSSRENSDSSPRSYRWEWKTSSADVHLRFDPNQFDLMHLIMEGEPNSTKRIAQLVAWIICTFRTANESQIGRVAFSEADVYGSDGGVGLRLRDLCYDTTKLRGTCWASLLKGALIAYGFPTPRPLPELPVAIGRSERVDEHMLTLTGVEMSCDCMTFLAGTQYPLQFKDGFVLKGHATLLVPVGACEGYVQWHLYSTDHFQTPIDLEKILSRYNGETMSFAHGVQWSHIRSMRHFVGYSPEARFHLGTSDGDYEPYEDSGAGVERPSLHSEGLNVSFGTEGMGVFVSCSQDLMLNGC